MTRLPHLCTGAALAAAGLLAVTPALADDGQGQAGQTASCSTHAQSTSSGGTQSITSESSQQVSGGVPDGAGGAGGSAGCDARIVQVNEQTGGGQANGPSPQAIIAPVIARLEGNGTTALAGRLTQHVADLLAQRIAKRLDTAAKGSSPSCTRPTARTSRCVVQWTAANGAQATVRVTLHAKGKRVHWRYRARVPR